MAEKFQAALTAIPNKALRTNIETHVQELAKNPRPFPPNPKLALPIPMAGLLAQYRLVISGYRVFYDVSDDLKKVTIIALRKRDEKTYRR